MLATALLLAQLTTLPGPVAETDAKPVPAQPPANKPAAQFEDQPAATGIDDLPLDAPPLPVRVSTPDYPREAIRKEISGRTVACFRVDPRGRIRNPQVVQASHDIFRKPTLKAVRQSSFKPARRGNDRVAANYCRTYRFDLELRQR